jgi:hypothetical protein
MSLRCTPGGVRYTARRERLPAVPTRGLALPAPGGCAATNPPPSVAPRSAWPGPRRPARAAARRPSPRSGLPPATAAPEHRRYEHRRYKGPVDGTAVLGTPTPAPPPPLLPPGTARTTKCRGILCRSRAPVQRDAPAPRRQRTDFGDPGVRMPLRRRAPPRDWEAPPPRPAAPAALPARATRRARRGSRGLPRVLDRRNQQ